VARRVYGGQPAQQWDGQRLGDNDDNAAAQYGPRDLVPPHIVDATGLVSFL